MITTGQKSCKAETFKLLAAVTEHGAMVAERRLLRSLLKSCDAVLRDVAIEARIEGERDSIVEGLIRELASLVAISLCRLSSSLFSIVVAGITLRSSGGCATNRRTPAELHVWPLDITSVQPTFFAQWAALTVLVGIQRIVLASSGRLVAFCAKLARSWIVLRVPRLMLALGHRMPPTARPFVSHGSVLSGHEAKPCIRGDLRKRQRRRLHVIMARINIRSITPTRHHQEILRPSRHKHQQAS